MDPFDEMERARRGRRILSFTATVALVLFLGFAVFPALFAARSSGPEYQGQVASVVIDRADVSPPVALAAGAAIETFEVFGGKNPFTRPLSLPSSVPLDDPDEDLGPAVPATPTTTPAAGGATSTTVPVAPDDADQQPTRGQAVALIDVFDDVTGTRAQIRVGSVVYLVSVGDVFATSYKVVSLDLGQGCGRFLFGDSAFDLCQGQEILK